MVGGFEVLEVGEWSSGEVAGWSRGFCGGVMVYCGGWVGQKAGAGPVRVARGEDDDGGEDAGSKGLWLRAVVLVLRRW